jgi:mRNA-degrading endonuclease RelE of RelBE toxin-antitoxin system
MWLMTINPVRIFFGPQFAKDLKRLRKKYLNIRHDVDNFVERLQIGELPGDQVQGAGFTVYKARLKSSDLTKGKSGGYRVIYFIQTPAELALITIYIKSERTDLRAGHISQLVDEYLQSK